MHTLSPTHLQKLTDTIPAVLWLAPLLCPLCAVAALVLQLAAHMLLLLGAPAWWGRHRDALLTTLHVSACLGWLWQALTLPPALCNALHGPGLRLLIAPLSFLLNPSHPRMALACCACITPVAYTTLLLLAAQDLPGDTGLGVLQAGILTSSSRLVWIGIAYSLAHIAVALLVSWAIDMHARRTWLRGISSSNPLLPRPPSAGQCAGMVCPLTQVAAGPSSRRA